MTHPILIAPGHVVFLNVSPAVVRDASPTGHGRVRMCKKCGGTNWKAESWRGRWCRCGEAERASV